MHQKRRSIVTKSCPSLHFPTTVAPIRSIRFAFRAKSSIDGRQDNCFYTIKWSLSDGVCLQAEEVYLSSESCKNCAFAWKRKFRHKQCSAFFACCRIQENVCFLSPTTERTFAAVKLHDINVSLQMCQKSFKSINNNFITCKESHGNENDLLDSKITRAGTERNQWIAFNTSCAEGSDVGKFGIPHVFKMENASESLACRVALICFFLLKICTYLHTNTNVCMYVRVCISMDFIFELN